jgi:hypothetical protein
MRKQRIMALVACLALGVCALPATAWAQDGGAVELVAVDAPMRVALVDATSKTKYSKSITKTTRAWLKDADGVDYQTNGAIEKALEAQDLSDKTLRSKSKLAKKNAELTAALAEAGLDGLVIVNGRSKGKYLDVIVVGANGAVLEKGSKKLKKRRRAKSSEVEAALSESLATLGDAVRAQRADAIAEQERREAEAKAAEAKAEASAEEGSAEDDPYGLGLKEEASLAPRGGVLTPGFALEVGGLLAQRSVSLTNDAVLIDHVNPFAGASGRLDLSFGAGPGRLGVMVLGSWGTGSAVAQEVDGSETTLSATYASVQGEVGYEYPVAETIVVGVSVRGERTSATLDPNPRYTGHRYTLGGAKLLARLGLGPAQVELSGGPLAVIDAETSAGAYGEAALAPLGGFFAGGRVLFPVTDMFALAATYELRSLGAEYDAASGNSSELMHVGSVGLRTKLFD